MIIDFSKYKLEILLFILFFYSLIFCNLSKSRVLFIESNDECMEYFGNVPNEYQEVEYIQSSGTQWVDTLITPNSNTKLQAKLSRIQNNDYVDVGYYAGNDLQDWRLFVRSEGEWTLDIPGGRGSGNRLAGPMSTDGKVFELEVGNYYIKDLISQQTYTGTASTFTGYSTIKLSRNQSTNKNNSDRFYYVKIREGDTMVRDFYPCYRKSDGVIGLYDKVSKTFFTNAGTGTFLKGHDVNVKRSEFQKVEYIQSSGTQYINTQYIYKNPNKVKYDLKYIMNSSASVSLFGSRAQTGSGSGYSGIPFEGNIYSNKTSFGSIATTTNTLYELSLEFIPQSNTCNVIQYTNDSETYNQSFTNSSYMPPTQPQPIGLFCDINGGGIAIQLASMKAYRFKIYDGDTLVRDFIPCYRKSDNVIGLIDDVNKVFYTNDGTGTFTKGGDIN